MSQAQASRIFGNLSAGSTTYMPDGKMLRFVGKIERTDFDVKVGHGYYETSDPKEIEWLVSLCNQKPNPMVWEVIPENLLADEVPANVDAGVPNAMRLAADDQANTAAQAAAVTHNVAVQAATGNGGMNAVEAAKARVAAAHAGK